MSFVFALLQFAVKLQVICVFSKRKVMLEYIFEGAIRPSFI